MEELRRMILVEIEKIDDEYILQFLYAYLEQINQSSK